MKKAFSILLMSLLLLTAISQAQIRTLTVPEAQDTLTNAATGYASLQISGHKPVVSFQLIVTKISGTVAGTANLEGSHNGTTFAVIGTQYTLTDATQTNIWTVAPSSCQYYRVRVTTTGTQASSIAGTALIRP